MSIGGRLRLRGGRAVLSLSASEGITCLNVS